MKYTIKIKYVEGFWEETTWSGYGRGDKITNSSYKPAHKLYEVFLNNRKMYSSDNIKETKRFIKRAINKNKIKVVKKKIKQLENKIVGLNKQLIKLGY